jgi:uncharacterized repeat protein (TIGR03803 family)
METSQAFAQTFNVLRTFDGTNGANPQGLMVSGKIIYGTTSSGGSAGKGSVFKLNIDGTAFTTLHNFIGGTNDGDSPKAGLILAGSTLFGTTVDGGSSNAGTVFSISTDGISYTNLHSFSGSDGANPQAPLALLSNRLYGTTYGGGSTGNGTVFALNSDGTGFTNLHSFTQQADFTGTNTDGRLPFAGLLVSGNTQYGTAWQGGYATFGTVFALKTDGTGFTNLHNFLGSDGANPQGPLVLLSNTLYGTTAYGGPQSISQSVGTVFALNTDGTGFRMLHFFDQIGELLTPPYSSVNNDGFAPTYLISYGKTLLGTALKGGGDGLGTVFNIKTDGSFNVLHDFTMCCPYPPVPWTTNTDGGSPNGLSLSGNTLYGTASNMGPSGNGTVFSLSQWAPQLAIVRSDMNVVLSWSVFSAGYSLQSVTNLAFPVWTPNLVPPVLVGSPPQYAVTNPISATQQFFRLSQ